MASSVDRQNSGVLRWLVALGFAAATWLALSATHFRPTAAAAVLALAIGAVALFSTEVATGAFVLVVSLPLLAANALLGLIFLVLGLAMAQYLGGDVVPVLLVVAGAFAGLALGPAWAVPVLAGYILGSSGGTLAAFVACVVLEAAGLMFGGGSSSIVFLGGTHAAITFAKAPENLLALAWVAPAAKSLGLESTKTLWSSITGVPHVGVLLVQPIVWALAAFVTAKIRRPAEDPRQLTMSIAGPLAGVAIAAAGTAIVHSVFGLAVPTGTLLAASAASVLVAVLGAIVWDRAFRVVPRAVQRRAPAVGQRGMASEDADVDELLRLIASAEDKIASQHTAQAVVMITDMKSFSRMTEEDGSFLSAKAVQRHRDLLLPLIEARGGKGKSTGGDGLIASFSSAENAICAAMDMQQRLVRHNAEHPREREIIVRIGIADGEVVLDKGGRPFIGAALNLAARVMSLGDGGQVLVTRDIANKANAPGVATVSHGEFELKNIARPVEVVEVLWHEGQSPCDPRTFLTPKQPDGAEATPATAES